MEIFFYLCGKKSPMHGLNFYTVKAPNVDKRPVINPNVLYFYTGCLQKSLSGLFLQLCVAARRHIFSISKNTLNKKTLSFYRAFKSKIVLCQNYEIWIFMRPKTNIFSVIPSDMPRTLKTKQDQKMFAYSAMINNKITLMFFLNKKLLFSSEDIDLELARVIQSWIRGHNFF